MRTGRITATIVLLAGLVTGSHAALADAVGDPLGDRLQTLLDDPSPPPSGDLAPRIEAFYAVRDFRPAWRRPEAVTAFTAALDTLADDGLRPADYAADRLVAAHHQAYAGEGPVDERARFDIAVTRLLLTALRHLDRGKVDPASLEADWDVPLPPFSPDVAALSDDVDALDFETAFARARPDYAPYRRLRTALAHYRRIRDTGGWPSLPPLDTALHPGDRAPAVAVLRRRLAVTGAPVGDSAAPALYDDALAGAVRHFQRHHYLEVDGVVGAATRTALNVSVDARIDQIRVNLERARWLLHGLPRSFVLVDIAGYRLTYYRPDHKPWHTRIVVGTPYRRTPTLRSEITHLTLNPTWTVPASITWRELLPRIRRDPGYLAREHLQVLTPEGRALDPAAIDWSDPPAVVLRQKAGADNALGRVVFRFPNPYAVYLHDTPARALFNRPRRAFSHGCIRVEHPLELARLLLDDPQRWDATAISETVATGVTLSVDLPEPVPVIVHYWTVNIAGDGTLAFKPDIYGRDRAVLAALERPAAAAGSALLRP
ncbi:L,D-transpeptidase family protein [Arhodomonas aquaeolei]|uniref:L,D-transpeptidase family protein n=1 Tax=Arhodomonas aquaeolei TaxID=2369 RepID=UPI0021685ED7|nr:L,D-transpeptidase family protein [Arhodomonas aquaeolei]MCS4502929.1 L,D-transpeptidase family protein [Arhodomonas aquaeolei]